MGAIKGRLNEDHYLKLILIDASYINRIEKEYGKKMYEEVLDSLSAIISQMPGDILRLDDIITINFTRGDMFYVFLSQSRKETGFRAGSVEQIAERVYQHINAKIFKAVFSLLKKRPTINVGYSIKIFNPLIREERLIDNLIEDAKVMTKYKQFNRSVINQEKIQELIVKEEIKTIYQPVINIVTQEIIGYEALSRGPAGTEYENPFSLFNIAEEVGLLFELDRLCRRKAFVNAKGIKPGLKLFVNIFPATVHDPEFQGKYLRDFLKDMKISPRSVVLEVSEQQVIENYEIFREASEHFSELGFAIAIDDMGMGYSNLKSIVELKLHYMKIDISLIRDVDKNPLKQNIVKSLVLIAKEMKAQVVAEGIETKEEYHTLQELGIIYGQGFLFARPAPAFAGITVVEM
jgi:EAL domain-containing protein (putative c-di-GMP-specific phosphodiesterase class I)